MCVCVCVCMCVSVFVCVKLLCVHAFMHVCACRHSGYTDVQAGSAWFCYYASLPSSCAQGVYKSVYICVIINVKNVLSYMKFAELIFWGRVLQKGNEGEYYAVELQRNYVESSSHSQICLLCDTNELKY